MEIRVIKADEWEKIRGVFEQEGGKLPNPHFSTAIVAEDEGEIVGFWCLELVPHAGPLYVSPIYRGKGLHKELMAEMEKKLMNHQRGTGFYVFSDTERTDHICEQAGMKEMGWKVWKREYKGDVRGGK